MDSDSVATCNASLPTRIAFTPTSKVRSWLDSQVTNPACQCCRRRDAAVDLNNTTTSARTKALQQRLLELHVRRRPLKRIDEDLAERRRLLKEKAQKVLNSSLGKEVEVSGSAHRSTSGRIKALRERREAIQERMSAVRKRDREFQERGLELKQKARKVLEASMASAASLASLVSVASDAVYQESPAKRARLSDAFQRNTFARKPTKKGRRSRQPQNKSRVVVPDQKHQPATQTSACLIPSSSAGFKTFFVGGLRCSVC